MTKTRESHFEARLAHARAKIEKFAGELVSPNPDHVFHWKGSAALDAAAEHAVFTEVLRMYEGGAADINVANLAVQRLHGMTRSSPNSANPIANEIERATMRAWAYVCDQLDVVCVIQEKTR